MCECSVTVGLLHLKASQVFEDNEHEIRESWRIEVLQGENIQYCVLALKNIR